MKRYHRLFGNNSHCQAESGCHCLVAEVVARQVALYLAGPWYKVAVVVAVSCQGADQAGMDEMPL